MKTFKDLQKVIGYVRAKAHKVFSSSGRSTTLPSGRAMAKRSSSSAGGGSASTGASGDGSGGSDD
jgi:hypothetical protein